MVTRARANDTILVIGGTRGVGLLIVRRLLGDGFRVRVLARDPEIIRVGFLLDHAPGTRRVKVSQDELPLAPGNRIARADAADAFVQALRHPKASRTTFDVVWEKTRGQTDWNELLGRLKPDDPSRTR